jgi:hydroxyacyl-ACP dehydratase HTD2-like protein with hotdog domain
MDLYDSVVWFDDWMHFMNLALLTGAFVLLTMPRTSSAARIVERALAFGATSAIAWEIAEYFAFLSRSSEREFAYADTLGDLALGMVGAVAAAVVVRRLWASGYLEQVEPVTAHSTIDRRGSTIAG